jgi:hypothetical protein
MFIKEFNLIFILEVKKNENNKLIFFNNFL